MPTCEFSASEIQNIDGVLAAARTEVILDRVALSGEDYIDPESFQRGLYPHWGILRRGNGEAFLLTERSLDAKIDDHFGHLPTRLIGFYMSSSPDQVRVLDVGGGRDGSAAKDIAVRYSSVEVMNVDLVAVNETMGNYSSRRGDVCDLDLPPESINLAYSHQVLPYMDQSDGFTRPIQVIEGVYRTLRPGGVALIDYTNEPSSPLVDVLRSKGSIDGIVSSGRKSYGGQFLFIAKPAVDEFVGKLSSFVPRG